MGPAVAANFWLPQANAILLFNSFSTFVYPSPPPLPNGFTPAFVDQFFHDLVNTYNAQTGAKFDINRLVPYWNNTDLFEYLDLQFLVTPPSPGAPDQTPSESFLQLNFTAFLQTTTGQYSYTYNTWNQAGYLTVWECNGQFTQDLAECTDACDSGHSEAIAYMNLVRTITKQQPLPSSSTATGFCVNSLLSNPSPSQQNHVQSWAQDILTTNQQGISVITGLVQWSGPAPYNPNNPNLPNPPNSVEQAAMERARQVMGGAIGGAIAGVIVIAVVCYCCICRKAQPQATNQGYVHMNA
jgi:hypothetical protein